MGWFDKKSWQLRRKIRDLQAELATAEREGKYVLEQGLFFAELQEMGDNTLMVLGTADRLDTEEETVIRNFIERNGFTVEYMKLDKTHKTLAAVEIIPPQELTRRVARELKELGYRLVDDSEQERPSNLEEKTLTLSGIVRAVSALFATHVHQLIVNTPLKMNMEGNRLLHWMPLVREALTAKCSPEMVALCRQPFVNAYNHYYGKSAPLQNQDNASGAEEPANIDALEVFTDAPPPLEEFSSAETKAEPHTPVKNQWDEVPAAHPDDNVSPATTSLGATTAKGDSATPPAYQSQRTEADAVYALANIYKSLVGASQHRRVRNAEDVLGAISTFFSAKSACLLSRSSADSPFAVQANSPGPRCIDADGQGNVCADADILEEAVSLRKATVVPAGSNGNGKHQAVIVPLALQAGADAVIYLREPQGFENEVLENDLDHVKLLTRAFREFPDLLIPEFFEKTETTQ